jgi:predicted nucleic acid-binding protein
VTVVDASVIVTAFARGGHADWAAAQLANARARGSLWAPHLIDAEVGHSLRRRVAARKLADDLATAALRDLTNMPLRRIVHAGLLGRAWQLRHNLSFYDGLYVALAEQLRVPLVTLDVRLAKAAVKATRIDVLRPS